MANALNFTKTGAVWSASVAPNGDTAVEMTFSEDRGRMVVISQSVTGGEYLETAKIASNGKYFTVNINNILTGQYVKIEVDDEPLTANYIQYA